MHGGSGEVTDFGIVSSAFGMLLLRFVMAQTRKHMGQRCRVSRAAISCCFESATTSMRLLSASAPFPNTGMAAPVAADRITLVGALQQYSTSTTIFIYKVKMITHRTSCQIRIRRMSFVSCNGRITTAYHHWESMESIAKAS